MATDLGSAGVTGIAGSAFANGNLDLFQYGQSTNYLYSAGDGSTDFTKGPALSTQIIDGGIPASSTVPAATAPEPATLVTAGSALIGIWFFSRRRLRNSEPAAFPNRDK